MIPADQPGVKIRAAALRKRLFAQSRTLSDAAVLSDGPMPHRKLLWRTAGLLADAGIFVMQVEAERKKRRKVTR